MYKELFILAVGFILGIISMYYILKPNIGNKYEIDADIKNKKGTMKENIFDGTISSDTPKKEGILKRIRNKRKLKKEDKNV